VLPKEGMARFYGHRRLPPCPIYEEVMPVSSSRDRTVIRKRAVSVPDRDRQSQDHRRDSRLGLS